MAADGTSISNAWDHTTLADTNPLALSADGLFVSGKDARLVHTAHVAQSVRARATESRNLETSLDSATKSNAPTIIGSGALAGEQLYIVWWRCRDLNTRPRDYEASHHHCGCAFPVIVYYALCH